MEETRIFESSSISRRKPDDWGLTLTDINLFFRDTNSSSSSSTIHRVLSELIRGESVW